MIYDEYVENIDIENLVGDLIKVVIGNFAGKKYVTANFEVFDFNVAMDFCRFAQVFCSDICVYADYSDVPTVRGTIETRVYFLPDEKLPDNFVEFIERLETITKKDEWVVEFPNVEKAHPYRSSFVRKYLENLRNTVFISDELKEKIERFFDRKLEEKLNLFEFNSNLYRLVLVVEKSPCFEPVLEKKMENDLYSFPDSDSILAEDWNYYYIFRKEKMKAVLVVTLFLSFFSNGLGIILVDRKDNSYRCTFSNTPFGIITAKHCLYKEENIVSIHDIAVLEIKTEEILEMEVNCDDDPAKKERLVTFRYMMETSTFQKMEVFPEKTTISRLNDTFLPMVRMSYKDNIPKDKLKGMSGSPVLDENGRIVGVIVGYEILENYIYMSMIRNHPVCSR